MEGRFEKFTARWIKICFCFVSAIILSVLLAVDKRIVYSPYCILQTLAPNALLIPAPILMTASVLFLWKRGRLHKICSFADKRFFQILFSLAILLLALQWFLSYHIFFLAGWDVNLVSGFAYYIANNMDRIGNFYYFSQYTNNIAITAILALIQELPCRLGVSMTNCYLVCVLADCVLINTAGVLAALSARKLTKSGSAGICTYLLFAVMVGISPWFTVPYTDTYSILFPILTFYLYLCARQAKRDRLYMWLAVWTAGGLGLLIKPNAGVVMIAVALMELVRLLGGKKEDKLAILKHFAMLAVAVALLFGCRQIMIRYTGAELNKEIKLTYTHYLMMGLNDTTAGSYSTEDYGLSSSIAAFDDRQQANLQEFKKRLTEYGPAGYLYFLMRKILTNYNDGTFSWWMEGGFHLSDSYTVPTKVTLWLRDLMWGTGRNYPVFATFEHTVWLGILFLLQGIIFLRPGKMRSQEAVMLLSLLGIFAFVMLFEARGRYLYCMSPMYVLCAVYGARAFFHYIKERPQKKQFGRQRKNFGEGLDK